MHNSLEGFAIAAIVAAVAVPGFPALAFVFWLILKQSAQEQALKHTERLKALELGQPLPDAEIAQLQAENEQLTAQFNAVNNRLSTVTFLALAVPLIMMGAAVGGTALVLHQAAASLHLPLICTAWGVCGIVSVVSLVPVILVLSQRRGNPVPNEHRVAVAPGEVPEARPTAIHEKASMV
jgi:hypothetical protein